MTKALLLAIVAAGLFAHAPAHAGEASLTSAVFKEVEARAPDGRITTALKAAGRVTPGDQVVYVLTYRNGGERPTEGVIITNPLAQNLTYAGPADTQPPLVSIDGQAFGPLASLTKAGGGRVAPAAAADVTALRWTLSQPVPAGGEVRLSFRARLK
jgi:uncharacterized repeat protein (TIGR01451 family)